MSVLLLMIPIALGLAGAALAGFLWCVRRGQFDDLDLAGARLLFEDADAAEEAKEEPACP